jgi:lipid II:glycine glycyltransferase (peptidoglycan interpeptide bridge formation enzyme)
MTTHCIFQEPWWLDASAPNAWQSIEIEKNGKTVARLPYAIEKKKGLTLITAPPYTHTLGPWLAPTNAMKYAKHLSEQKDLLTELIDRLPPHDYFVQKFHPSITNWLPFHWKGFTQTSAYTYTIGDLSDLDAIWAGFQENTRREIRKAQKQQLLVESSEDIDYLYYLSKVTFERQNIDYPASSTVEKIRQIDRACASRQRRKILLARDSQGKIHAGIYLVWDENSAYYLVGGADPEFRTTGAMSLLLWEAIQFSATVTKQFDFVGSMNESIERFVRGFGGKQVSYFVITKMSQRMKIIMAAKDIFTSIRS